jgi:hypothetical protein
MQGKFWKLEVYVRHTTHKGCLKSERALSRVTVATVNPPRVTWGTHLVHA